MQAPKRRLLAGMIAVMPLALSFVAVQPVFAASSSADVSIRLVADRQTVRVGQAITYTATMTNHGPNDAFLVDTQFVFPGVVKPGLESCDLGISADSPFCEYSLLKAGQTVVSTYVVVPTRAAHRSFTVTAKVSFEVDCSFDPNCTFDPNMSNNTASVSTTVTHRPR